MDDIYPHIISYFWEKHAHVCGFVVCCFSCLSSCCGCSCYHYNLRVWRLCWRPFLMRATVYSDSCVFILFVRINTYCLVCLSVWLSLLLRVYIYFGLSPQKQSERKRERETRIHKHTLVTVCGITLSSSVIYLRVQRSHSCFAHFLVK